MGDLRSAFDRIDRQQMVSDQRITDLNKKLDDSYVPRSEVTLIASTLGDRLKSVEATLHKMLWAVVTLVLTVIAGLVISVFKDGIG